jgi:hypothetical protein
MKSFVALFAAALLPGCVATTEGPTPQMNHDTLVVEQAYALCKNTADSSPEAMRLSESFVLGKNKSANYLEKATNENYATDEQISDIRNYRTNLKICRAKAVEDLQTFDKEYATLVSDYFFEDDKISTDIVNKKITIGEANRKITKSEYYFSLKGYDIKGQM